MTSTGYKILGWAVWWIASRVARENRAKLGAAGVVALVLVGGLLAARAGQDS